MEASDKVFRVKELLQDMGSVLVAFSGGTDSTLLATLAYEVLGDRSLAVLVTGSIFPDEEESAALATARQAGFPVRTVGLDFLANPGFVSNPPDRCYHCRKTMIIQLKTIAAGLNLNHIIDGNNYDDLDDYRPGRRAALEGGIRSPFIEAEMTKAEIRAVSRQMGLPTWNKPASPCLASRIPYGTPITKEILASIAEGEAFLRDLGIRQVRLRHHGDIARIEIGTEDFQKFMDNTFRLSVVEKLKTLGYKYVTLDLSGYRTGSLNIGVAEKRNILHD